jgi:hypothetical protein
MAIIKVITPSVTDANITTAKVTDNAITLAKMASGTDGNIISYDASGNPVAIATGSDGQVLTSTGAGSPPAFEAAAAGGKVLQVVQGTHATQATFSTTSYQASATDVTITPSSSSSKILVFYTSDFYIANADSSWDHTLYRDSTNLGPTHGFGSTRADVPDTAFQIAAHFLDTPNTTNATKYEFYVKRIEGSGNLYLNGNHSKSVITAMEIAG